MLSKDFQLQCQHPPLLPFAVVRGNQKRPFEVRLCHSPLKASHLAQNKIQIFALPTTSLLMGQPNLSLNIISSHSWLPPGVPTTQVFLPPLKHSKHSPASGPLHLLFLLPGTLPQAFVEKLSVIYSSASLSPLAQLYFCSMLLSPSNMFRSFLSALTIMGRPQD